jgi:hypothetical protein
MYGSIAKNGKLYVAVPVLKPAENNIVYVVVPTGQTLKSVVAGL